MKFLVYSKHGCPYCYKVMQVLEMTGKQFVEYKLGREFTGEEFYDKFGEVLHSHKCSVMIES